MRKTVMLAAALGALSFGVPAANAAPAGGAAINGADFSPSLVQQVARRRVCTFKKGYKRCVWKQVRNKKRWQWRKNRKGVRVRIFL